MQFIAPLEFDRRLSALHQQQLVAQLARLHLLSLQATHSQAFPGRWQQALEEAKVGFQDIDTNDDGLIDFQEFVAWWAED